MSTATNWEKLYKQYKGQWVALAPDGETVIAHAPTAAEAQKQALKLGQSQPILTKIPQTLSVYVG